MSTGAVNNQISKLGLQMSLEDEGWQFFPTQGFHPVELGLAFFVDIKVRFKINDVREI